MGKPRALAGLAARRSALPVVAALLLLSFVFLISLIVLVTLFRIAGPVLKTASLRPGSSVSAQCGR